MSDNGWLHKKIQNKHHAEIQLIKGAFFDTGTFHTITALQTSLCMEAIHARGTFTESENSLSWRGPLKSSSPSAVKPDVPVKGLVASGIEHVSGWIIHPSPSF